jgi:hypothetical protein
MQFPFSRRLTERAIRMKEAQPSTTEALRDTRYVAKYLQWATTLLSGSETYKQRHEVAS